jgi:nicotinamidase-related amidase
VQNALLVIDIQDSFKAGERWTQRNNPAFEENVTTLIEGFRRAKQPVIYFLDDDGDEHFNPRSPLFRLMDFLKPREGEPIIHKYSRNCFTTTNLQQHLVSNGVSKVTICGIKTEQCCETTARIASDLGFQVDFVTEATLTFPISGGAGGRTLSADDVVERTEFALRDRFAAIKTVEDVLSRLG